jgi:hypothetical protein
LVAATPGRAIETTGGVNGQLVSSISAVLASGKGVENGLGVLRQRRYGQHEHGCDGHEYVSCGSALMRHILLSL